MKSFKTNFIIKAKIDKKLALKLAMTIGDEENLKYVTTLITSIDDEKKLKLFI